MAGEGCGQGRDDVRVSHRLWRRVDGAQEAEAGPRQARAPQKDVPWRVRLLSADYAAGGWAGPRAASGTGWCRPTSDAVEIRFSPPPVAGSQLVDVDGCVPVVSGDGLRSDGRSFENKLCLSTRPCRQEAPSTRTDSPCREWRGTVAE